jgi:hypothetical protein
VPHRTTAICSPISIPYGTTVSPDVGVDSSYRAEAGGPHAAALVEDRLEALLTGSAGPVMWDALPSELTVTEKIITEHNRRSNPEWARTNLHMAHDISRHLHSYSDPLLPQAAGAASIASRPADIHPDTLVNAIAACRPRIDIDRIDGEPASAGRTI